MENIACPLCGEKMTINSMESCDKHISIKDATKLKGSINLYSCNKTKHVVLPLQYLNINDKKFGPYVFISEAVIFINYDDGSKTFAFLYKDEEGYFVQINYRKYGPWEVYPFLIYDNRFVVKTARKNKFNNAYLDIQRNDYGPWRMIHLEFDERIEEAKIAHKESRQIKKYEQVLNDAYRAYRENTNRDSGP